MSFRNIIKGALYTLLMSPHVVWGLESTGSNQVHPPQEQMLEGMFEGLSFSDNPQGYLAQGTQDGQAHTQEDQQGSWTENGTGPDSGGMSQALSTPLTPAFAPKKLTLLDLFETTVVFDHIRSFLHGERRHGEKSGAETRFFTQWLEFRPLSRAFSRVPAPITKLSIYPDPADFPLFEPPSLTLNPFLSRVRHLKVKQGQHRPGIGLRRWLECCPTSLTSLDLRGRVMLHATRDFLLSDRFPNLKYFGLQDYVGLPDESDDRFSTFSQFTRMQTLESLSLDCFLQKKELKILGNLRHLKKLSLQHGPFPLSGKLNLSNDDWAFLERMENLQELSLQGSPGFNDETLDYVKSLPKLRFLELDFIKITHKGIETLTKMNLRHLALVANDLTDDDLLKFDHFSKLQDIILRFQRNLTEEGLYCLTKVPTLRSIFCDMVEFALLNRARNMYFFLMIANKLPNLTYIAVPSTYNINNQLHEAVDSFNNRTNRGLVLLEDGDMTLGRLVNLFPEDAQEPMR